MYTTFENLFLFKQVGKSWSIFKGYLWFILLILTKPAGFCLSVWSKRRTFSYRRLPLPSRQRLDYVSRAKSVKTCPYPLLVTKLPPPLSHGLLANIQTASWRIRLTALERWGITASEYKAGYYRKTMPLAVGRTSHG